MLCVNSVAQRMNENIVRRLFRHKVTFRFYPQCEPCSNQQGSVVKQWKTKLRTHFTSLRLYHSTGLWLVLLCTGGLYVGGSNFHGKSRSPLFCFINLVSYRADIVCVPTEMSDLASSQPQTTAGDNMLQYMSHQATSEQSLLVSLREREMKLFRQLKKAKGDAAEVAAINAEIDSIVQCKKSLKANLKRSKASQA